MLSSLLEKDVEDIETCLTGSSIIVNGGNTVFNKVIFSIGPKYDVNYDESCDRNLWSAYYSALNIATSYDNDPPIKSISICCLYLKGKKYPRDLGAHIALRTIRKFMSHPIGNKLEKIIICCNNPDDYAIYQSLMPAYFPRNIEEALLQTDILPDNLGSEWGEIRSSSRGVTLSRGPRPSLDSNTIKPLSIPTADASGTIKTGNVALNVTWTKPRQMTDVIVDGDDQRVMRIIDNDKKMSNDEKLQKKYDTLARKLDTIDLYLKDIEDTNFVRIIGNDRLGQAVVLITVILLLFLFSLNSLLLLFLTLQ